MRTQNIGQSVINSTNPNYLLIVSFLSLVLSYLVNSNIQSDILLLLAAGLIVLYDLNYKHKQTTIWTGFLLFAGFMIITAIIATLLAFETILNIIYIVLMLLFVIYVLKSTFELL
jgi:hypothetical protein